MFFQNSSCCIMAASAGTPQKLWKKKLAISVKNPRIKAAQRVCQPSNMARPPTISITRPTATATWGMGMPTDAA